MGRRWAAIPVSVACSLLVCEMGLRAIGRFEPPPPVPIPPYPHLYRPDPDLGYTLWPSSRTTYHYPLSSPAILSLVSNADGFRSEREFDEPDARRRIWMLGDSMVFGDGVAAPDRITNIIEAREPEWRVDNLGMTGWGLDLMVRAFEKTARRVQPDLVVLAFYTDDFVRLHPFYSAQGFPFRKFEVVGGTLVDVPFPAPIQAWRRPRVVQAIEQTYWRYRRNRFDLNGALLERLHRTIREQRSRLAVAFLPGRGDTPEDRSRRTWLRDWCATVQVPFVDLTEPIHSAGESAFIPGNEHYNERGHRLAGEAIHRFLRVAVVER